MIAEKKMREKLLPLLLSFLQKKRKSLCPLLLAYSGGPDSTALLYLLLECQKKISFPLHLAHVDHGWRKESTSQAKALEQKAKTLALPFHLKKLPTSFSLNKNLEEEARKFRYQFFEKLSQRYDFEAIFLAHQKEDVAETVLKRILEGASLPFLGGMQESSKLGKLTIWRPLLSLSKKELLAFLEEEKLTFIDDESNRNQKFLRGRMREKIFPFLTKNFGKEIRENLFFLSKRAQELQSYLDQRVEEAFSQRIQGPLGLFFDFEPYLSSEKKLETIEKSHLLKRLLQDEALVLSRYLSEAIFEQIESKKRGKWLVGNKTLYIDQQRLFILKQPFPYFSKKKKLKIGLWNLGGWQIRVEKILSSCPPKGNWESLWKGEKVSFFLPKGDYEVFLPRPGAVYKKRHLTRWWSEEKVPLFLRFSMPVIYQKELVTGEFLLRRTSLRADSGFLVSLETNFGKN